jgi:hypothetical protein
MTEPRDSAAPGAPTPADADTQAARDPEAARRRTLRAVWFAVAGAGLLLLLMAQFSLWATDGTAPLSASNVPGDPGAAAGASTPTTGQPPPPSPDELAAEEPLPITDAVWRFFEDDTEANRYYDVVFEQDGSCGVLGDETIYDGRWAVFGTDLTVELSAREPVTQVAGADNPSTVEYTIVFAVRRAGNTMRGVGEADPLWVISGSGPPQSQGRQVFSETVYARPLPEES